MRRWVKGWKEKNPEGCKRGIWDGKKTRMGEGARQRQEMGRKTGRKESGKGEGGEGEGRGGREEEKEEKRRQERRRRRRKGEKYRIRQTDIEAQRQIAGENFEPVLNPSAPPT